MPTPTVLEMLVEECPYDMVPGEYWVMIRELWEGIRKTEVPVKTRLILRDNGWYVGPLPVIIM